MSLVSRRWCGHRVNDEQPDVVGVKAARPATVGAPHRSSESGTALYPRVFGSGTRDRRSLEATHGSSTRRQSQHGTQLISGGGHLDELSKRALETVNPGDYRGCGKSHMRMPRAGYAGHSAIRNADAPEARFTAPA